MTNLIFKAFEPFRDVIEEVSDERPDDGIWVYPIEHTAAAESVCAPGTLHESTVKELVAQLKDVADEIRTGRTAFGQTHEEWLKEDNEPPPPPPAWLKEWDAKHARKLVR